MPGVAESVGMTSMDTNRDASLESLSGNFQRPLKLVVTPAGALPQPPLPDEITEDYVNCKSIRGLTFHILEAGYEANRPLVLLLHGFPELAFSWRKIMPTLASAQNYVVAVDQRGYGRTVGWDDRDYDKVDLSSFSLEQYVRDVVALINALGYKSVRCVVGHDFGARVAALCALMLPDVFKSCVLISEPFKMIPDNPLATSSSFAAGSTPIAMHAHIRTFDRPRINGRLEKDKQEEEDEVHAILAHLDPPRKHARWYNASREAAVHYRHPPQGMKNFLRGYMHLQSGSSPFNRPRPLHSWTTFELEKLPNYHVMPLDLTMPETVHVDMIDEELKSSSDWLDEELLAFYTQEWTRTGFQGALNGYRVALDPILSRELVHFAGMKIKVPTAYAAGNSDWATFLDPNVLQQMPRACDDFHGIKIIQGAGHWPHEEKPGMLACHILNFMWKADLSRGKSPIRQSQMGVDPIRDTVKSARDSRQGFSSPPMKRDAGRPPSVQRNSHRRDSSIGSQLSSRTYDPDAPRRPTSTGGDVITVVDKPQSNDPALLVSPRQIGPERAGSAAPAPEEQERRQGPASDTSSAAKQGSRPGSGNRPRAIPVAQSQLDFAIQKTRADTPATNALMGKERAEPVQPKDFPKRVDSPIPELASPAEQVTARPPLTKQASNVSSKSSKSSDPARDTSSPSSESSATSQSDLPVSRHAYRSSNAPKASKRTSQQSKSSPDSSAIAEENARILQEVQQKAWKNLQDAEKTFHRMGISVKRADRDDLWYSSRDLDGNRTDGHNQDLKRDLDRRRDPRQRSSSAAALYRNHERARSDEAEERRRERTKAQTTDFDMRTHPGTATADRDRFETPAGMRS